MVLMRFKVLINLVRKKVKRQTIRKERQKPIKPGNLLQIYASDFVGLATVVRTEKKALGYLTEQDAIKDGFPNLDECLQFFMKQYKCDLSEEFVIISYDPHYEATVVVPLEKIEELEKLVNSLSDYFLPIGMLSLLKKSVEELKAL